MIDHNRTEWVEIIFNLDFWISLFIVFMSFTILSLMVPQDLLSGDATELTYGIQQLSTVHPPGYPLYRYLSHALIDLLGWTYPRATHLISTLYGSLALGVFYVFLRRRGIKMLLALGGLILFVIAMPVWPLFIQTEVYTLAFLFFVGSLYLWDRLLDQGTGIYLLGFWVGLGLTHHPVGILNILFLIHGVYRFSKNTSFRRLILLFFSPVILYGLLLYPSEPFPLHWPDLKSSSDVITHMLGGSFDRFYFASGLFTPIDQLVRIGLAHLAIVPLLAAFFVILGYFVARGRDRLLIYSQIVFLMLFIGYEVPDLSNFLLPSYALSILFFLIGLERFEDKTGKSISLLLLVFCIFGSFGWSTMNDFEYDRHDHRFFGPYVKRVDRKVSSGTIIADWATFTPLRYHQLLRKRFEDVSLITLPPDFSLKKIVNTHRRHQIPLYITSDQLWELPESVQVEEVQFNGLYQVDP